MGTRLTSVLCLYAATAAILLTLLGLMTQTGRFAIPLWDQLLILGAVVGAQFLWAKGSVAAESEAVESGRAALGLKAPGREIENLAVQVAELKNKASQLASALRRLDEYVPSLASLGELNREIQELASTTRSALQFSLSQATPLIRLNRESGHVSYLARESLSSPRIPDDLAVKIDRLSALFERRPEGLSPETAKDMLAELSRIREEIQELSRITERGNEQIFYLLRDYLDDSRESRQNTQAQIAKGLMSLHQAIAGATERIAERLSVIAESVAPAKTEESPTGEGVKEEPEVSGE